MTRDENQSERVSVMSYMFVPLCCVDVFKIAWPEINATHIFAWDLCAERITRAMPAKGAKMEKRNFETPESRPASEDIEAHERHRANANRHQWRKG